MKLVRLLCRIGNGLLGLISSLTPLGRPAPYSARVIFLKAKEIQPTRPPKAASPRLATTVLHLTGLTTLIMAPTFLSFTLEEKKKKKNTLNLIILTAPGVVFVILRLTGRARESRGSEEKWCKSLVRSQIFPEPGLICSGLWWCLCGCGWIKYLKPAFITAYARKRERDVQYLSLTVHISQPHICLGSQHTADPITCNTHFSLSHSQSLSKLPTYY